MAHENYAPRLSGNLLAYRITSSGEAKGIGPMAANVVEQEAATDIQRAKDTRRGRRGQTIRAYTDPKEPTGALELVTVPARMLAMLFLGTVETYTAAYGAVSAELVSLESDYWSDLAHRHISGLTITAGVNATLATGVEGNNNAITWTAAYPGAPGNSITVELDDPSANNAALSVTVTGTAMKVNLATGAGGAITSTAAQVMAAIVASAAASALVTVDDTGASTGAAAVVAVAATPLASGAAGAAVASSALEVNARLGSVRPVVGGALDGAAYCLVSYTHAAKSGVEIHLGADTTARARLVLDAVDDGGNATDVVWEAYSALITPNGAVNLMSAEPITAKFALEFETPSGYDHPTRLIWPDGEPGD